MKKLRLVYQDMMKRPALRELMQFIKFGIVGVSNTAISLAFYYLFLYIDASLYMAGYVIGFFVSVLNAYFWNNCYVFHGGKGGFWKPLLKSYAAYGGSFLLSSGLLYAQVQWLSVSRSIAPLVCLLVTIPLNFLVNKFWTFR